MNTHGHFIGGKASPTHITWRAMIVRCTNPSHENYKRYGAKGVTVCARWLESFEAFLADVGERPPGMTLDRIDSRIGYEPGNVRWATHHTQASHRSTSKLTERAVLEIHGRVEHGESQGDVADRFGVKRQTVNKIRNGKQWVHLALALLVACSHPGVTPAPIPTPPPVVLRERCLRHPPPATPDPDAIQRMSEADLVPTLFALIEQRDKWITAALAACGADPAPATPPK